MLTLVACTPPNSCNKTDFTAKFECQMDKAKKYCLDKGFVGHEPEYRSCVIGKSSEIINADVANSLTGV